MHTTVRRLMFGQSYLTTTLYMLLFIAIFPMSLGLCVLIVLGAISVGLVF